ncbi:MAG: hypothetical protein LBT59_04100 [Clostridiales bacterium]|jgi:uncharacterized protein YukE|nr:hypothetical protein [Clostridiales bacterium]
MKFIVDPLLAHARQIENDNAELRYLLEKTIVVIHDLEDLWTGEEAKKTISYFEEFSENYFNSYQVLLDQYVKFLRDINVSYEE